MNHWETPRKRVRREFWPRGKGGSFQKTDFLKAPFLFSALLVSHSAQAYIYFRNKNGDIAQWPKHESLIFKVNAKNKSQLSEDDIFQILTRSLNRWKQTSWNAFDFAYHQGTSPKLYPTVLGTPRDNIVFFTSNASHEAYHLNCSVVGLTNVWMQARNGHITKADIRFNDLCYTFSKRPEDTIEGQKKVYFADAAQHEFGHVLGLDHSQNLLSSMIYAVSPEMARPSCDEQAALLSVYPSEFKQYTGSIQGSVEFQNFPLFGAHLQAIHLERGYVFASALSGPDGKFNISSLEPGHYALIVEPYYPGPGALNPYYSRIRKDLCSSKPFPRLFHKNAQQTGMLSVFKVEPQSNVDIGIFSVSCDPELTPFSGEEKVPPLAPMFIQEKDAPIALHNRFQASDYDHFYFVFPQPGLITARLVSYSLFEAQDLEIEFLSLKGNQLPQSAVQNGYFSSTTRFLNYDPSVWTTLESTEPFYVHVMRKNKLKDSAFSTKGVGVSHQGHYVLSVSNGVFDPLYASSFRCVGNDAFSPSPRLSSNPVDVGGYRAPQSQNTPGSTASCGTIQSSEDSSEAGSRPQFEMMSNFLLWVLILVLFKKFLARYKREY